MKVILRPFHPQIDSGFILSSWAKQACPKRILRGSSPNRRAWFIDTHAYLMDVLARAKITVACLEEDLDFIVGYQAIDPEEAEFIYIKASYRNQGVEALLENGAHHVSDFRKNN